MAGSMYYQGVSAESRKPRSTDLAGKRIALQPRRGNVRRHQASVDKVMAWNDGSVGPPGSMLDTERVHPAFRTSHVSFSTNMPSRSSVGAAASHISPAGASAFKVSSPGEVSPFSLNSSPATAPSMVEPSARNPRPDQGDKSLDDASRTPGFIAPIPSQLNKHATKPGRPTLALKIPDLLSEPIEEAADSGSVSETSMVDSSARNPGAHQGDSSVEDAPRVPSFIAPTPSQPERPSTKSRRPTLTLKIADLISEPIEEATDSGSGSETNIVESAAVNRGAHQVDSSVEDASHVPSFIAPTPSQLDKSSTKPGRPTLTSKIPDLLSEPVGGSALSGSGSEADGKTTPIATPAHAKRLPAEAGTRSAKAPKKVSLSDELGDIGETVSESGEQGPSPGPVQSKTSVHDWAHEKHRYVSPESSRNPSNVTSEPLQHEQGVTEVLTLGAATTES
ncbi:MAG: hypothetical protein Q9203_005585 [Teloschistes exilis]